jgi:hypothetical protein
LPGAGLKRLTQQLKAVQAGAGGRLIAEGTTFAGRFVVGELLGDGPFGQVYVAQDKEIEDKVALKVLRAEVLPTEKDRERYFSVTRSARTNTQRHVARLHESGEHEGLCWVSRQYLDSLSLRKVLKLQASKGEVFSLDELERLITHLTHALQHIGPDHSHGDLKPENIFLMPDILKVTDAYVMAALPPAVVAARLASSPYLAPELRKAGGTLTPRCDVYSLGVIVSEVAFGTTTPPAAGSERGEREEIAALCRRAMSEAPTARPGSAEAFSEELGAILDAKRLGARRPRAATPAAPPAAPAPPTPPVEERRAVTPPAAPAVKSEQVKPKAEPTPAPKAAEPPAAKAEEPKAKPGPKKSEPKKPEAAKKPDAKKPETAKKPDAKTLDAKTRTEDEIATVELDRSKPPELGDLLPTNEVDRGAVPAPRTPQLKRETTQSVVVDRPGQTPQQGGMSTSTIVVIVGAIVVAASVLLYKLLEKPEVVTLGDEPVAQSPVKKDDPVAPVNPSVELPTNPPTNPVADTTPAPNPALDAAANQAGASVDKAAADALAAAALKADSPAIELPKVDTPPIAKVDPPKVDPPKVHPPKADTPKVDPPKADTPKVDPPKADTPKVHPPKADTPRADTPAVVSKVELPKVDNKPAATGTKCPSDMALVKRKEGNVCVDQYEFPGKGQRPKTNVSWFDARKSCEAAGKRLCAASEWRAACGGKYPYGKAFDANKCNTQDEDGFERSLATGGSFGGCKSPSGVYDMTGNVHEWVEEKRIAGGAFDSDASVANCGYSSPKAPASSSGSIGFRCCAAPE